MEKTNTVNSVVKGKSCRICGWILTIIGGLLTLGGIFSIATVIYYNIRNLTFDAYGELIFSILGVFLLLIGIPLLVLGIWLLFRKDNGKYHRTWGWALTIFGGLYTSVSIIAIIIFAIKTGGFSFMGFLISALGIMWLLILIIGILLLCVGIWEITHNRKTTPAYLGELENK